MVVAVFGDEKSVVSAIEAGACGYLLKDRPHLEIAQAILDLLEGGSPISAPIARYLLQRFRGAQSASDAGPPADAPRLSDREREVLSLIAKGFRYAQIADLTQLSAHTVATYVRRIYRKLEVSSRGEAVYEAMNLGLIDRS